MSSVTSFFAFSISSFDSARVFLATVISTLSVVSATTSIDPHTLSISSDRAPLEGIAKVFWMFSWSLTGQSRSESSLEFAKTVPGSAAARNAIRMLVRACVPGALLAGRTGSSSAIAAYTIKTGKKVFLRTCSSSIQLAQRPVRALLYLGIQIRRLREIAQAHRGIRIAPFQKLVDQRHLHQRRLLLLKRVHHSLAHLWLRRVTAERIQRRQSHVHAPVVAQRMHQRGKHLRIELILPPAVAHSLQPLARGLLLQHREHHELPHVRQLGMHRGDLALIGIRTSRLASDIVAGKNPDHQQCGAPRQRASRRA